jgi:hypothetical protein
MKATPIPARTGAQKTLARSHGAPTKKVAKPNTYLESKKLGKLFLVRAKDSSSLDHLRSCVNVRSNGSPPHPSHDGGALCWVDAPGRPIPDARRPETHRLVQGYRPWFAWAGLLGHESLPCGG